MSLCGLLRLTPMWANILFFGFQYEKHMYYVFTRICIIKEYWWSLVSPWSDDVWKKVFKSARNDFKYIYPQTVFRYSMFYDAYHIGFIFISQVFHSLYF